MDAFPIRNAVVGVVMIVTAGVAFVIKPTHRLADTAPRVSLERSIPRQFGDWRVDGSMLPIAVSPVVQARIDKLYDQVLARTYVNGHGQRVMVSIAYGGDQRGETTQVHRPEYCYASQGFEVVQSMQESIKTGFGSLRVERLVAVQGPRHEPITYWITVGDRATLPGIGRKLAQLAYGLKGQIADGMVVRISSIDPDERAAYRLQDDFLMRLLTSLDPEFRVRMVGATRV
jgi:EpsI family protein